MEAQGLKGRLDRPVDLSRDHLLGPANAPITLVEYGSYACPYCRAANDRIAEVRDELGDRLRYVFRHRPLTGSDIAQRAAELAERAAYPEQFWQVHLLLMTRSETLTEDDLLAAEALLDADDAVEPPRDAAAAKARVEEDERSAKASGVLLTPSFFINSRRYDGPWDESSFTEAMLGTLGHRVRMAAFDFASWGSSAGLLLLLATLIAVLLSNSPLASSFAALWEIPFGLTLGDLGLTMSLHHWINDGLLTLFFLVVGLEIKREFTVGHLAKWRSAALPVAAAIGGMVAPAAIYGLMLPPESDWSHGWGIPMATDTAFALAVIAALGRRVPVELRIFLTAAAIVDDIGAILVVAVYYSGELHGGYLLAALAATVGLAALNRSRVYGLAPYVLLGLALWAFLLFGGLHATLAGVVLALFIPTRPPANLKSLMTQAKVVVAAEAKRDGEVLHQGPSAPAIKALDTIFDRLESPADRLLRHMGARSSYVVLPLFALSNAGLTFSGEMMTGHNLLMIAIIAGLLIGKPLGMIAASALAVFLGLAVKPQSYSWLQLAGVGALAGIGFTMSLFIAGQAFGESPDFAAAKLAVFIASVLAASLGTALLLAAGKAPEPEGPDFSQGTRVSAGGTDAA